MIAPANVLLVSLNILDFFQMLSLLDFNQLRAQHLHSNLPVLVLASLILTGNDYTGWNMGNSDGGFGFIDMLAAGSAGPVGIDLQVLFPNLYCGIVVDFRHYF